MWRSHRRDLSQNFLRNELLVSRLVSNSSIGKNDTVIEIGLGKGIITRKLLKAAKCVIGVELDNNLNSYLLNKLKNKSNFILYGNNFLDLPLPLTPYKVFSNLPFSIEGEAIRKLIDFPNPPLDCYLVMRSELAFRLGGITKESMFSIMHKPWFDFSIYYSFKSNDFFPAPKVNAAMLRFTKREEPLVPWREKDSYQEFIKIGFGQGLPVFQNLKKAVGHKQGLATLTKTGVSKGLKPSFVTLQQWIGLYKLWHARQ